METAEVSKSFWGDKLYQQRARKALPLIVRQALIGETIFYSDLADELEMPNARNLNYVLGCIGTTLIELSKKVDEKIPPIQCLVVNKATELPGEGFGWFISEKDFKKLSNKQKKVVVDSQLAKIFSYSDWLWVLDKLGIEHPDFPKLSESTKRQRGGGEGQQHKELKEYIANNPSAIGLSDSWPKGEIEFGLPSGDSVDVMFSYRQQMVAVEVKSRISDSADINRGLFQCVKYQAVTEAMLGTQGKPQNVQTLLVLESSFPKELTPIKNMLGVRVISSVGSKKS
ncbi:hypothetical protein INR79_22330 [Vibrio sp. SCSIO 43132]|uniref:hypothetical protein n=1 Tax=Vibrio sp. SCSIO 43132 TaxID=2779363 RepID=UPI001CA99D7B|nr:hypothetical protein [Vibrio sp. SCSIO 43132]UAB73881.1 hypothetical protein INR79_22330 [Vibrio sp. SCSIO 43132]